MDESDEDQGGDQQYVVFPEEAIQYLPKEWQQNLFALKEEAQGLLVASDGNLRIVHRIIHAFPTLVSLRYILHRLSSMGHNLSS